MDLQPAGIPSPNHTVPLQKKLLYTGAIVGFVILYAVINIGVFAYAKKVRLSKQAGVTETVSVDENGNPLQSSSPLPTSDPTPTPTPRPTGPGIYACDPIGICNNYEDAKRKDCPRTYADNQCLDQCGNKTVQCPQ